MATTRTSSDKSETARQKAARDEQRREAMRALQRSMDQRW